MIGSSIIFYDIMKDRKTKLKKVYNRLMLAMSFGDFFLSFVLFLGTWPIPKEDPSIWSMGNQTTCTLQGYFQQFFMTSLFYNTWLSIYYIMVICWSWKDAKIVPYERFAHFFNFTFSITTATIALVQGLYGPNLNVWCYITDWNKSLILSIGWQWACVAIVVICMIYLLWNVFKQFGTVGVSVRSASTLRVIPKDKLSLITTQAFLYAFTFLLSGKWRTRIEIIAGQRIRVAHFTQLAFLIDWLA